MSVRNLGTQAIVPTYTRPYTQHLIEMSTGALLYFARVGDGTGYKKSLDYGDTWDSAWTIVTTGSEPLDINVLIDANNNIRLLERNSSQQEYYYLMTYTGSYTWSLGASEFVDYTSTSIYSQFAQMPDNDLWIAHVNTYCRFSSNDGDSWSNKSETTSSGVAHCIVPRNDSNPWCFTWYSHYMRLYIWNGSSWTYDGAFASNMQSSAYYHMGVRRISDDEIYVSGVNDVGGIELYTWNGTAWDAGTIAVDTYTDCSFPCVAVVQGIPTIFFIAEYDGIQTVLHTAYKNSAWTIPSLVYPARTSGCNYLTTLQKQTVNPTTDTVYLAFSEPTAGGFNIMFASQAVIEPPIEIAETLSLSENFANKASEEIGNYGETLILSDTNYFQRNAIELVETLNLSETVLNRITQVVNSCARIISVNPLMVVTDTDPAVLVEIDVSDPDIPVWYNYNLNVSPETVVNAKDVTYDSIHNILYIACADGQLMQVDTTDFYSREQIDTTDLDDFLKIAVSADVNKVFASTGDATGEIILMQDVETNVLSADLRLSDETQGLLVTQLNLTDVDVLMGDLRIRADVNGIFNCDMRVLATNYEVFDLIKRTDFHVYIDDVETDDVDLSSITIRHVEEDRSSCRFVLGRKHDALDVSATDVSSVITNQNNIKIYIKTKLEFEGEVSGLTCNSQGENVTVDGLGAILASQKNTISLPLSTLNTQLHPYDVILNNPVIYNPVVGADEENPPIYKGVEVDMGTKIQQHTSKYHNFADIKDKVKAGTWVAKANNEYFWFAIATNFVTSGGPIFPSLSYIGTSPSGLSAQPYQIVSLKVKYQRQRDDKDTEMGLYRVGSAPYKSVSATNGLLNPFAKWEDRSDGLYDVLDDYYDYRGYTRAVANAEFEKMKTINGQIAPLTSVTLSLTMDGYLYYSPKILTRINVDNTTTANIYKNNNGFPVAVKVIDIQSNPMTVTITADNTKSQAELEAIEDALRKPSASEHDGWAKLIYRKYSPMTGDSIQ